MWTLDDALLLVRLLQPAVRDFGYHLCLGGGVLNTGASAKDLDLYLLPLECTPVDQPALLDYLTITLGVFEPISGGEYEPEEASALSHKLKFDYADRRIDVFIVKGGTE